MDTSTALIALPIALAVIMLGLGLHLTVADFTRIARHPKPVAVALACQLLVLPAVCFLLVVAFALPTTLAVGMMLLAASPGGTTANLYSHLFRGDVALNISLTAINSVVAIISLPVIVNLSLAWFDPGGAAMGLAFGKILEVFLVVLAPVGLGMIVRRLRPGFADAMQRPVRIASAAILVLVVLGAVAANSALLAAHMADLLGITVCFCAFSLGLGYLVPRWFGISRPQAIASSFEIGIHNATLAIVVARSILGSLDAALPAAIYGVVMFPLAAAFGFAVKARSRPRTPS